MAEGKSTRLGTSGSLSPVLNALHLDTKKASV